MISLGKKFKHLGLSAAFSTYVEKVSAIGPCLWDFDGAEWRQGEIQHLREGTRSLHSVCLQEVIN
jgi:hypothetical protein